MARINFRYFTIFTICFWSTLAEKDFQFENVSNMQVTTWTEAHEESKKPLLQKNLYSKEMSQCPYSETKIMLSLILKSYDWNDIPTNKKTRALNKASRFFAIPKEFIKLESTTKRDIYEMTKRSIKRGINNCENLNSLGKIEFMIGCGQTYFIMGEPISNQIAHQFKDGSIDDIIGLNFGWWVIWRKKINNRVQRFRRQAEGSGDAEEYENYDDDDDYDTDNEQITDLPISTTHAHRHHHGIKKNRDETTFISFTEDSIINNNNNNNYNINNSNNNSNTIQNNQTKTITTPILITTSTIKTIATATTTTATTKKTTTATTELSPTTITTTTTTTTTTTSTTTNPITYIETSEPTSLLPSVLTKKTEAEIENRTLSPKLMATSSATDSIIFKSQEDEFDIEGTTILPPESDTTISQFKETLQPLTTVYQMPTVQTTTISSPVTIPNYSNGTTILSTGTISPSLLPPLSSPSSIITTSSTTTTTPTTTTTTSTTPKTTTSTPTTIMILTTEYMEPERNNPPIIKNRIPKQPVTAGKPFSLIVPYETFFDEEDGTNLRLELFDKNGHTIKSNSWIQFSPEKKEIYGLPLEDAVSRWQYKLVAYDSKNESVTETLDITVQQHKGHRSVNHEITLIVKLNNKFERNIDWQIRLVRGIATTLNDKTLSNIVVREVRQNQGDTATFIYTNETLPKDKCPEDKLDELAKRLEPKKLTETLYPDITIKSVTANPIGPCIKPQTPKSKPTPNVTRNYAPVPRNQVDRVNATIGHLLVYKVPFDTFYDHEDNTDLKLSLLTSNRDEIKPTHWLQFDSKNREFYGVPKYGDVGTEEYLLVAEDSGGLTANDALQVVVNLPPKRDLSILFKMTLGMPYEEFNKAAVQRKFVERLAQLFSDQTSNIHIRSIQPINGTGNVIISFFNTTLLRINHRCPDEDIEIFRKIYFHPGHNIIRDKVKNVIGNEFHIMNVTITPLVNCHAIIDNIPHEITPIKTEDKKSSSFTDDYLLTFILPAVIILAMLLLASIIACVLHRRRLTGKMELGDEEERRSFRSKGIPVIFQDELDEKPEIGNKSPIILKDEKPPLLPPSYNSTNLDGDNDVDEYVPPPAVVMGGREVRGKSPVTPSYRKPPPYVSP